MYCSNELNLMLIHKIGYEINLSNQCAKQNSEETDDTI